MKRIYILGTILLCSTLLVTGCSVSFNFGKKSDKKAEATTQNTTENNSNSNIESNSNSNNNTAAQHLTCSKDYSSSMSDGIKMTQDVEADFKDEKVDKLVMYMNFELPESYATSATTYFNNVKTQYDNTYGKYNGVSVTTSKDSDMKFTIAITMDYQTVSAADKTAMGFVGSESYETNKIAFEREGYTCK